MRALGVKIQADGESLILRGPTDAIEDDLREAIRSSKFDILELLAGAHPGAERSAPTVDISGGPPALSAAQSRFLELQALEPDSTVYNLPGGFRLLGPLDYGTLRAALGRLVERQPILRSVFRSSGSTVGLEYLPPFEPKWAEADLTHLSESEREPALREYLEEASDVPIDLSSGPPFHLHLVRMGPEDHALLITAHSAVWDGWSFDVFLQELGAHYEGVRTGTPSILPPLDADYAAYARTQTARRRAGHFDRSIAYWEEELAGSPPSLSLSRRRGGSVGPESFDGARVPYRLESAQLDRIRRLARERRATTNMVLVAALDVLLYRCTGESDIMISTPFQGRTEPVYENLIGVFVNTLFLRTRVDPEATFGALVEQTRDKALAAVEHQDAPSDAVIERIAASGLERTPHEIMFVFQQAASRNTRMADIDVRSIMRGVRKVSLELIVWAREYEHYLDGAFDYRLSALDEARARRLRDQYLHVIEEVLAHPDMPLKDLDLDLAADRSVREARGATAPTPEITSPVRPGDIVCGATRVPSSDVVRVVDDVRQGAASSGPTAIVLDGSWQSVASLQALATIDAPCVVAEVDLAADGSRVAESGVSFAIPEGNGESRIVRRSWAQVRADAAVLSRSIGLEAGRGIALYGDLPPTAFVSGVVAAGLTGSPIFLPEPDLPADGLELDDWLANGTLDTVLAGSVSLRELTQTGWETEVRTVVSTDPFMGSTLIDAVEKTTGRLLTGWCPPGGPAWAALDRPNRLDASPGTAAAGIGFEIVDRSGQPAALDAPGDLIIVDHRAEGRRLHPIGVRARWPADDRLRILSEGADGWEVNGRHVVGRRVAEVLMAADEVADAHVFLEETAEGGRVVQACLVPADGVDDFRARVAATKIARATLPRSWVPGGFQVLSIIPRDPTGALDIRSLRLALRRIGRGAVAHPESETELAIARAWESALGLTGITADDNFFDIGGHSLLAVQVVAHLAEENGLTIEPRSLFFHSLSQLARSATPVGSRP